MHAAAYCPRHVDPFPSVYLSCLSLNLCCAGKGPRQGVHAQAQPYTPTGKGRVLLGAFSSTAHTGTGTGSEGGSDKTFEMVKVSVAVFGLMAAVSGSIAYGVHTYDTDKAATEMKLAKADVARIEGERKSEVARIHDKAATEIKLAATEIARVEDKAASEVARIEGDRNLSEQRWKAEVERYKYVLELAHSRNFARYQAAILGQREKRRGTEGLEKEEEKN